MHISHYWHFFHGKVMKYGNAGIRPSSKTPKQLIMIIS